MLSFFPRDVLDEILNLMESVSEGFPSYFYFVILITAKVTASAVRFSKTSSQKEIASQID